MPKKEKKIIKKKEKMINSLGIDLSIGKVKICLTSVNPENKSVTGAWSSLAVPFEYISEKNYDFAKNLFVAIEAFLKHHNKEVEDIDVVVFCTGGGYYMSKTFAEGMRYTAGAMKMIFPRQKVYFIRCDSELTKINDIFELEDYQASGYICTNFLGTSLLAKRLFTEGLAIDMGTISTSIIPILNNEIDPMAKNNPFGYVQHRYATGKHIWFGAMHTDVNHITHVAKTKRADYPLILRSCTTSTICSILGILEPEDSDMHVSNLNKMPDMETSFMRLAETIGLDTNSISRLDLFDIAADIYDQMKLRLVNIIRSIVLNMNFKNFDDFRVLSAGLGQSAFIIPALKDAGFYDDQIITLAQDKQSNLWSATSVYGLAILGAEKILGEKLEMFFETSDGNVFSSI
ncbi:MAG: hypothetical protein AABZ74_17970 [Cyanobacteriota bacterium]